MKTAKIFNEQGHTVEGSVVLPYRGHEISMAVWSRAGCPIRKCEAVVFESRTSRTVMYEASATAEGVRACMEWIDRELDA